MRLYCQLEKLQSVVRSRNAKFDTIVFVCRNLYVVSHMYTPCAVGCDCDLSGDASDKTLCDQFVPVYK